MPTYVYRRPDGTTFEVSQKISAPKLTEDPETGVPVERVISGGAGLQFKGSGFYLTDYARSGSDKPSGESKSDSATPAAKPESKPTAAKPAASSGSGSSD